MTKLITRDLIEWTKDYKAEPLEVCLPILDPVIFTKAFAIFILEKLESEMIQEEDGILSKFGKIDSEIEDGIKTMAETMALARRLESCSRFTGTKNHLKKLAKMFEQLETTLLQDADPYEWAKRLHLLQSVAKLEGFDDISLETPLDLMMQSPDLLDRLKAKLEMKYIYVNDPESPAYQEYIRRMVATMDLDSLDEILDLDDEDLEDEIPDTGMIYQFKVSLDRMTPPVWRRIQISADASFGDLHDAIQDAMGWHNSHMHEFHVGSGSRHERTSIGMIGGDFGFHKSDGVLNETKEKLSKWLSPKSKSFYTYDFGDSWEHTIILEKTIAPAPGEKYPQCIVSKGDCPPEDCGGIGGYEELLDLKDRKTSGEALDEEEEERLEYYGMLG